MKFQGRYWFGHLAEEFPAGKPPDFLELYECIAEVDWALDPNVYGIQEEWRLGDTVVPRKCAFCGKTETEGATFSTISHAIPENLGNKRVVSSEECDVCNNKYSDCEAHIAKMLSFERIFSGARGKSGPAEIEAGPHLSIRGQGVGRPIILKVDTENNPIQYLGTNAFEFSSDPIEFRPVLALRSFFRSAWLTIPPSKRVLLKSIRELAVGENVSYPLDYILVFSPGAPPTIGRLRVWCPRSGCNNPESWPPLMVTMSLLNTTIVWRAPLKERSVPSPLPPLPCYDEKAPLKINQFQVLKDEIASAKQNWEMHYETKTLHSSDAIEDNLALPRDNPLAELRKAQSIQIAVSSQFDKADWIQASVQVKKLAGDFSGIALMTIRAPECGIILQMRRLADGKMRLGLEFNGVGLPIAQALTGIRFSIDFFNPPTDGKLLFNVDKKQIQEMPLEGDKESRETAEELTQTEQDLLALQKISQALSQDFVVPDSMFDRNLIRLAAHALSQRCLVSLRENVTATVCLTPDEYDLACKRNEPIVYPIGEALYPFAGVPAFTKDVIGPVYIAVGVEDPAQQFPIAIAQQDTSTVKLDLKLDQVLFIFERFVELKINRTVDPGDK